MNRWVKLLIWFLLIPMFGCGKSPEVPLATGGVMNLSAYSFHTFDPVALNGDWEFYYGHLYEPDYFTTNAPTSNIHTIRLPQLWNGYKLDGAELPATGYATFRLRLMLAETDTMLGIRIPEMNTSSRFYINGCLISTNGKPATNESEYRMALFPQVCVYQPKTNILDIVIQVANYKDREGGIRQSIHLGNVRDILATRDSSVGLQLFSFGILFVMSIYHLLLYFLRRKEPINIYFSIACLFFAIKTLCEGEKYIFVLFPNFDMDWYIRIWFLTFAVILPMLYQYFYELFPKEMGKIRMRVLQVAFYGYGLVVLLTPMKVFVSILIVFNLFYIVFFGLVFSGILLAVIRRKDASVVILLGLLIPMLIGINDILYAMALIPTGFYASVGFLIMIVTQSYVISYKFSIAFRDKDFLTKELAAKNTELQSWSFELERKVVERTNELQETNEELQSEIEERRTAEESLRELNEALRIRNERMETDLDMARKIQFRLIPKKSPNAEIAFSYKPMERVGGDYFDFVQFRNQKRIGIFISDVSGHGVSAAFITSMIKSLFMQVREFIDSPAEVLQHLNDLLVHQTAGNFVTAFYGIYDPDTRTMSYSNAGHNAPYLIDKDRIVLLPETQRSIPLAILDNAEMATKKKAFINEKFDLSPFTKILFYTDGLTEAVNIAECNRNTAAPDFEEKRLREVILDIQKLSCREFISALSERLIDFHGSDKFDDDVCIICMDIK